MDKTIVGLIAAIGSIATMAAAQAAVTPDAVDRAMNASSFALQSGPNVSAIPRAAKAATTKDGQVQVAQYMYGYGYHPYGYGYGGGYGYGYGYPHYGVWVWVWVRAWIWWVWVWWVPSLWVRRVPPLLLRADGFALAARSM